jgi:hypothetical protein
VKNFVTQTYDVELTDGSIHRVCCAPQMLAKFNKRIKAYKPVGAKRFNACCHVGRSADIARRQNEELNDYLKERRWFF